MLQKKVTARAKLTELFKKSCDKGLQVGCENMRIIDSPHAK